MDYLDTARRMWTTVYLLTGVGMLVNVLSEASSNALNVCAIYPQFSLLETFLEEISLHQTWLPLARRHVSTLHLLMSYVVVYIAQHWKVLDWAWWLYHVIFEVLPTYLPFGHTELDVPELLSDDDVTDYEEEQDDIPPSPPLDNDACNQAFAKLLQVKMQHANCTIARPDDWLVFDPVRKELVLQKLSIKG